MNILFTLLGVPTPGEVCVFGRGSEVIYGEVTEWKGWDVHVETAWGEQEVVNGLFNRSKVPSDRWPVQRHIYLSLFVFGLALWAKLPLAMCLSLAAFVPVLISIVGKSIPPWVYVPVGSIQKFKAKSQSGYFLAKVRSIQWRHYRYPTLVVGYGISVDIAFAPGDLSSTYPRGNHMEFLEEMHCT